SRPLIVTDPGLLTTPAFRRLQRTIPQAPLFSDVHPNPTEIDIEAAFHSCTDARCDGIVAFGGGGALDVGKAVRLRLRRPERRLQDFEFEFDWKPLAPFVAIPTTAGTGSEVGRSSVIIIGGRKRVFFLPPLLADVLLVVAGEPREF